MHRPNAFRIMEPKYEQVFGSWFVIFIRSNFYIYTRSLKFSDTTFYTLLSIPAALFVEYSSANTRTWITILFPQPSFSNIKRTDIIKWIDAIKLLAPRKKKPFETKRYILPNIYVQSWYYTSTKQFTNTPLIYRIEINFQTPDSKMTYLNNDDHDT